MKKIREDAEAALKEAAATMKRFYDRTKGDSIEYKAGDQVWLEGTNIRTDRPAKKLGDKRYGPFSIIEKVGSASYRLKLPAGWKTVHPVFNEVLLSPFKEPQYESQRAPIPPPPVLVDDVEEYEVEEILDSKMYRGKLKYLVHWKGYPKEERTWEPESNLTHADELIKEFHRKKPSAPRRIAASVLRFVSSGRDEAGRIPVFCPRRLRGVLWEAGKLDGLDREVDRDDPA